MLGFITLPGDFATTTLGYAGTLIVDLSPLLMLIVGVAILCIILEVVVGIFRR